MLKKHFSGSTCLINRENLYIRYVAFKILVDFTNVAYLIPSKPVNGRILVTQVASEDFPGFFFYQETF